MKLLHESEDCIFGIILGILIIGFSGKFFTLPKLNIVWGILFAIAVVLSVLDVINTLTDLGYHHLVLIGAFLNNLIDLIIEVLFMAKYFGFSIPFFSKLVNPLLSNPTYLFCIGVFVIATSVFWLIANLFLGS